MNFKKKSNLFYQSDHISTSTIQCRKSHLNLFKKNNITDHISYFENRANEKIDNLRTIRDNKLLSDSYKVQIANTIKTLNENSDVDPKQYKRKIPSNEKIIIELNEKITKMSEHLANQIVNFKLYTNVSPAYYETCILLLFILSTSLRYDTITSLKMDHLDLILTNSLLTLRNKTQLDKIRIVPNKILVPLIKIIKSHRNYFINLVRRSIRKQDDVKVEKFNNKYLFLYSRTTHLKTIKTISQSEVFKDIKNLERITSTNYRKTTTSILVSAGGEKIAQSLNHHKTLKTTLDYYASTNLNEIDKTFDSLKEPNLDPINLNDVKKIHEGLTKNKKNVNFNLQDQIYEDNSENLEKNSNSSEFFTNASNFDSNVNAEENLFQNNTKFSFKEDSGYQTNFI